MSRLRLFALRAGTLVVIGMVYFGLAHLMFNDNYGAVALYLLVVEHSGNAVREALRP